MKFNAKSWNFEYILYEMHIGLSKFIYKVQTYMIGLQRKNYVLALASF